MEHYLENRADSRRVPVSENVAAELLRRIAWYDWTVEADEGKAPYMSVAHCIANCCTLHWALFEKNGNKSIKWSNKMHSVDEGKFQYLKNPN